MNSDIRVLDSCQDHQLGYIPISHMLAVKTCSTDTCGKQCHTANVGRECREIQIEPYMASAGFDSVSEDGSQKLAKQRLLGTQVDGEIAELLAKTHTSAGNKKNEPHQQPSRSPPYHHLPSASGEMPLNKLVFGAGCEAARVHPKESDLLQRGNSHRGYHEVDKISKYRDKYFAYQIFLARKFANEAGMRLKQNSLSGERSDILGFFQEKDSYISGLRKASSCSPPNEVTIRSILAAKVAEYEGFCERKRNTVAPQNGKSKSTGRIVVLKPAGNVSEQQTNHCSLLTSKASADKIVVLKPAGNVSEKVACDCSSIASKTLQSRRRQNTQGSSPLVFNRVKKMLGSAIEVLSRNGSSNRESKSFSSPLVPVIDSCITREHVSWKNVDTGQAMCKATAVSGIEKLDLDMVLEAKWQLSLGCINRQNEQTFQVKQVPKKLRSILSSPESTSSQKMASYYDTSGFPTMQYSNKNICGKIINSSPGWRNGMKNVCVCTEGKRTDTSSCKNRNKSNEIGRTTKASPQDWRPLMKCGNLSRIMRSTVIESHKDHTLHSRLDSPSENEPTSTTDDLSSTSLGIYNLQLAGSVKPHKEYQSPVSVFEPFVVKKCFNSPGISHYKGEKKLEHIHLEFDKCLLDTSPEKEGRNKDARVERSHLSDYVQKVLQASHLNRNEASAIEFPPQKLLQESLFREVDILPDNCYFQPKLLFDHINEVLMEILEPHYSSVLMPAFFKPKKIASLAGAVLDQIMDHADFYILPFTKKRNLGHLVSEDMKKCRSWVDIQLDIEIIVNSISEDVLKEFVVNMLLEFLD